MSLRLIAQDLYRLHQAVHQLEKALSNCQNAKRDDLKRKLSQAKKERDRLRRMLDGHLDR